MSRKIDYDKYGILIMFIRRYEQEHGKVPTRVEIAKYFNVTKARGCVMLNTLVKYGYVTKQGKYKREYKIN